MRGELEPPLVPAVGISTLRRWLKRARLELLDAPFATTKTKWQARARPLAMAPALRGSLDLILLFIFLHAGLATLGFMGANRVVYSGLWLLALHPAPATLLVRAGLHLMRAHRWTGRAVLALGVLYSPVVMGLLLWLPGRSGPAPVYALIPSAICSLSSLALIPLAILGRSLVHVGWLTPKRLIAGGGMLGCALAALTFGMGLSLGAMVMTPLLTLCVTALLWGALKPTVQEQALAELAERFPELDLVQDTLPMALRYTLPSAHPTRLMLAKHLPPTPLGNPVLDNLLPLRCADPRALARRVQGHEGTVLAVLHAWPDSTLEPGALVWQADLQALQEAAKASSLEQVVEQAMADSQALVALLEGA